MKVMRIGIYLLSAVSAIQLVAGEYVGGKAHDKPVDLDDDSFQVAIDDSANHFWFLKFYAPWCGHCKAMAPVLESVAAKLEGKMAIGKIDCTKHKKVCDEHKVRGFPTLKYSIDGKVFDYTGSREESSLINFAERMSSPAVQEIVRKEDAKQFAKTKTDEGIVFLGSGKKSSKLFQDFSKVARKNQASGYFLWLEQTPSEDEKENDISYVERIEAGVIKPRTWEEEDKNEETLEAWVKDQNIPTLATLTRGNFSRISRNGRPILMAIVDMENNHLVEAIRTHMLDYIMRAPQKYVDKHYFALFDGKKWQKFLSQFGVKEADNPQYLILAPLNLPGERTYWRNETYTTLGDFLEGVESGNIPPRHPQKLTFNDDPMGFIREKFVEFLPFSILPIFILLGIIVILATPAAEYDEEDFEDDLSEEQEETKKDK